MQETRRRRLYFILILLTGIGLSVAVASYALRGSIDLYLTPSQLIQHAGQQQECRLGGLVVKGSVHDTTGGISFALTDYHQTVTVTYRGILPSLFREGQGIVAQGHVNAQGVFVASQVLAKHDENYHPPGIPKEPVYAASQEREGV